MNICRIYRYICISHTLYSHCLYFAQIGSEQLIASPLRVDERSAGGFAARALVDEEHGREAVTVYQAGWAGWRSTKGSHGNQPFSHGLGYGFYVEAGLGPPDVFLLRNLMVHVYSILECRHN